MKPSKAPLIGADAIARRVAELADSISHDSCGRELLVVPVLKGSIIFAADLVRALSVPLTIDFVRARSYQGTRSQGSVEFLVPLSEPVSGKHVLVVEDIIDTGRTTAVIMDRLEAGAPASLRLCVLLDKHEARVKTVQVDYVGFEIENHFVVGYGLDYEERFRELPAVHLLEDE